MKIVIRNLLFTLAVFLNSIELSSQSVQINPEEQEIHFDIYFYADENNRLRSLEPAHAVLIVDENFIVGVDIDGQIRPVFNNERQMVLVSLENYQNIPMLPHIAQKYGFVLPQEVFKRRRLSQKRIYPVKREN